MKRSHAVKMKTSRELKGTWWNNPE